MAACSTALGAGGGQGRRQGDVAAVDPSSRRTRPGGQPCQPSVRGAAGIGDGSAGRVTDEASWYGAGTVQRDPGGPELVVASLSRRGMDWTERVLWVGSGALPSLGSTDPRESRRWTCRSLARLNPPRHRVRPRSRQPLAVPRAGPQRRWGRRATAGRAPLPARSPSA